MIKARLAKEVGIRNSLRVYWDGPCNGPYRSYHNAMAHINDELQARVEEVICVSGDVAKFDGDSRWPIRCDHCGLAVPANATRQLFVERLYDTPSGKLEPGCLYWAKWYPDDWPFIGNRVHLMAVCPNGEHWDIDGRASNCTLPEDRNHHCWVRHGEPPEVTVDKNGKTCSAGAGSIIAGDYHGFLQNGFFT